MKSELSSVENAARCTINTPSTTTVTRAKPSTAHFIFESKTSRPCNRLLHNIRQPSSQLLCYWRPSNDHELMVIKSCALAASWLSSFLIWSFQRISSLCLQSYNRQANHKDLKIQRRFLIRNTTANAAGYLCSPLRAPCSLAAPRCSF